MSQVMSLSIIVPLIELLVSFADAAVTEAVVAFFTFVSASGREEKLRLTRTFVGNVNKIKSYS